MDQDILTDLRANPGDAVRVGGLKTSDDRRNHRDNMSLRGEDALFDPLGVRNSSQNAIKKAAREAI